jgi:hypothetical protein
LRQLVEKSRLELGSNAKLSYIAADSKNIQIASSYKEREKIKRYKRLNITDTSGHLVEVRVYTANIHDTVLGCLYLKALVKYLPIKGVCVVA